MAIISPPSYMQAGSHPAQAFRRPLENAFRYSGIVGPDDYRVLPVSGQRKVTVAAGEAIVVGTENTLRQGAYHVLNDASVQLDIAAADGSYPRYDLIVLQVRDAEFSGASSDAQLAAVTGTPGASPAEPAIPANSLVLARVRVNATVTNLDAAEIIDRKPLIQGQLGYAEITAAGSLASGAHDSGLSMGFVMPALAVGQRVLLEAFAGQGIITPVAAGVPYSVFPVLTKADGSILASGWGHLEVGWTLGSAGIAMARVDNTRLAAGFQTLKLRSDTSPALNHQIAATSTNRAFLSATLV